MDISEKIKKALECCILETDDTSLVDHCKACPYQPTGLCFRTLLKDALAYIQQLEHENKDLLEERELNDCLRDKVQQFEAQAPKWISVEERLPKRNQRVVVTDGKHAWDYGQFNGLAFCFEKENPNPRNWNWKKHTVRHVEWWMLKETALPEPPKEG